MSGQATGEVLVGQGPLEVWGGPLAGPGPGSRLAGYLLEEQIGAGGMAVVYRARDLRLGRLVALKVMAPAMAGDETFRVRFIREARATAAVNDLHIIPVYEAGDAGGVLFIAMRFVTGGDVRSLLHREGPLPPRRVMSVISPVASALDAAHAVGLVHRDVKPANMLVDTGSGRPDHVDHAGRSRAGLCRGDRGPTRPAPDQRQPAPSGPFARYLDRDHRLGSPQTTRWAVVLREHPGALDIIVSPAIVCCAKIATR
jgi:serine/threonine protein kinase